MNLRLLTGIVAGLITFTIAWAGPYWWLAYVLGLLTVASIEWAEMIEGSKILFLVTLLSSAGLIVLKEWTFVPLLLIVPAVPLLYFRDPERGQDAIWSAAGIVWLSFPAGLIFFVREEFGFDALAVLMLVTIVQDSLAYYAGYLFGGDTPFTPELSPNKTWAGFFGSLLGAVLVLGVGGVYMKWPWYVVLISGVVLGLVGQAGDLSISALKRQKNIDDTGSLFPGHGGILDRVDALLYNVVVFYPICRFVEANNLYTVWFQ